MTQTAHTAREAKIRPKRTHQQLFGMLGAAHSTVEFCFAKRMLDQLPMLLQIFDKPELIEASPFTYGQFCKRLNDVAEAFGCWTTDCPQSICDLELDGGSAYLVVLTMLDRSLFNFDNKKQLLQLVEPLQALFSMLDDYGTPRMSAAPSIEKLANHYLLMSRMSWVNQVRQSIDAFDEARAQKQALRSCSRMIEEGVFSEVPHPAKIFLYEHMANLMGSQHALSQARKVEPRAALDG